MREKPPKPPEVRRAQIGGDHKALSAMGKKGAEAAAKIREMRAIEKAMFREEAALQQAQTESISPEGDVLPPLDTT